MTAFPLLRRLIDLVSMWGPGFNSSDVCVGFVVDKVAIRQVPEYCGIPPVTIILPVLHTHCQHR